MRTGSSWFPADWVSEMREQIRLWFYSQFFMSVVLVRPFAVPAGARLREDARRAGPRDARLVGEHDPRRGRVRADGRRRDALAVLRPAARPQPALRLRPCARDQAEAAHLLALGQVPRRLRRTSRASRRPGHRLEPASTSCGRSTAGSSSGRSSSSPRRPAGYEATLTVDVIRAFDAFVDDVSNWYIRRSRRRFYSFDEAAFRTLWFALVQSLRVIAPVMPFLADHLWRNLVPGRAGVGAPRAAGPTPERARREPARRDRARCAGSSSSAARHARRRELKHRQPLRRLVVAGAAGGARGTPTRSPTSCA